MSKHSTAMGGIAAIGVAVVLGLTGCSHEADQTSQEKPDMNASASASTSTAAATQETNAAQSPVSEDSAKASDRYGHFGSPAEGQQQAGQMKISAEQKRLGQQQAKDTVAAWVGDHSDASAWRKNLASTGTDTFKEQVKMTDPKLIDQGTVTGLGDSKTADGSLTVTVKTTAGNYQVLMVSDGTDLQPDAVTAEWRNK